MTETDIRSMACDDHHAGVAVLELALRTRSVVATILVGLDRHRPFTLMA